MSEHEHTHHVIVVLHGGVPDYGAEVFHRYADAMVRWEELYADGLTLADSSGRVGTADESRYLTDGHDREARWDQGALATPHDLLAVAVRRALIAAGCDVSVRVDVDEWMGCDEPWGDPVYVTATDAADREFVDAVADLDSAPFSSQVEYVAEQLLNG